MKRNEKLDEFISNTTQQLIDTKTIRERKSLCEVMEMAYMTILNLRKTRPDYYIKFAEGEQEHIRRYFNITHAQYNALYKVAKTAYDLHKDYLLYLGLQCAEPYSIGD